MSGVKSVHAKEKHIAIQNTSEQKVLYTDVAELTNPEIHWSLKWGIADIETREGSFLTLD